MTVRARHLGRVVLGFVAAGFVVVGLSVEAVTRSEVSRARRALPDALARTLPPDDAGRAAADSLAGARRHLRAGDAEGTARALEPLIAEHPTPAGHELLALAFAAADRGTEAARNLQLAARLAPGDLERAARAEHALDLDLAWRARPATRVLAAAAGVLLLVLGAAAVRRRHAAWRVETFLDEVRGRLLVHVDGETAAHAARLEPDCESLAIDVFLSGRHGMACPRRPRRLPTLHLAFSHAASSRTVRLTPVRDLRDSALRVPVSAGTLRAILAAPGRWRLHAQLGRRPIATAELEVRAAERPACLRPVHLQR